MMWGVDVEEVWVRACGEVRGEGCTRNAQQRTMSSKPRTTNVHAETNGTGTWDTTDGPTGNGFTTSCTKIPPGMPNTHTSRCMGALCRQSMLTHEALPGPCAPLWLMLALRRCPPLLSMSAFSYDNGIPPRGIIWGSVAPPVHPTKYLPR